MPAIKKYSCVLREEKISSAFKHALVDKGWTTKHLATLCNMDAGNLSRVINHPAKVKLDTILLVASKLGIDSIPI